MGLDLSIRCPFSAPDLRKCCMENGIGLYREVTGNVTCGRDFRKTLQVLEDKDLKSFWESVKLRKTNDI